MDDYELTVLMKLEVFVFRLPPLSNNRGYKAADWNLNNPDWIGRLRLVSIGNKLEIRLEDKTSGSLYAKAIITELGSVDFEPVSDSSRYFVIRLRNDNGRTAFVGIGFSDRSDSFDLNASIQDHFNSIKKCENEAKNESNAPKLDLGFKEGQTITVNLGKKSGGETSTATSRPKAPAPQASGIVPLLPPPPSNAMSNRVRNSIASSKLNES